MSGFDAEKFVDAMAPAVGLEIDPAHRPGVVMHLEAAFGALGVMRGVALSDIAEPAPIFHPEAVEGTPE